MKQNSFAATDRVNLFESEDNGIERLVAPEAHSPSSTDAPLNGRLSDSYLITPLREFKQSLIDEYGTDNTPRAATAATAEISNEQDGSYTVIRILSKDRLRLFSLLYEYLAKQDVKVMDARIHSEKATSLVINVLRVIDGRSHSKISSRDCVFLRQGLLQLLKQPTADICATIAAPVDVTSTPSNAPWDISSSPIPGEAESEAVLPGTPERSDWGGRWRAPGTGSSRSLHSEPRYSQCPASEHCLEEYSDMVTTPSPSGRLEQGIGGTQPPEAHIEAGKARLETVNVFTLSNIPQFVKV
ncbi:hypothetical protein CYMTET_55683, partial [Cymbomonas tetramitiformis]